MMVGRVDCWGDELDPVVWLSVDGTGFKFSPAQARQLSVQLAKVADVVDVEPLFPVETIDASQTANRQPVG